MLSTTVVPPKASEKSGAFAVATELIEAKANNANKLIEADRSQLAIDLNDDSQNFRWHILLFSVLIYFFAITNNLLIHS